MDNEFNAPQEISEALLRLGLDSDEVSDLMRRISKGTRGLLIYGSRARGDYTSQSDFDLLRLSSVPKSTFKTGRASVSSYTEQQLQSADRTLFGTHLVRDGVIIFDPNGDLAQIVGHFESADPDDLLLTVHRYSIILDQPQEEKEAHCSGLVRLARYLLRTAVYAKAMTLGDPCFSVRELAERFGDPALSSLLASDPQLTGAPSVQLLEELTSRLTAIIGPIPRNLYGSLSATAVNTWESDRNLSALAVRAASEDGETIDYTDLPKVLL